MLDKNYNFTIENENGEEILCDLISLLENTKNDRVYIVYTDYSMNDRNQFKTFISEIKEEDGKVSIIKLKNKKELEDIKKNYKTIYGRKLTDLITQNE